MAQLVVIYNNPQDLEAFEDHYEHRHLPLAAAKMPGVRGARTFRVLSSADGGQTPYYRVAVMNYDSIAELKTAVASDGGSAWPCIVRGESDGSAPKYGAPGLATGDLDSR